MGNYPKAIETANQGLNICQQLKDTAGIIQGNLIISWAYNDQGEYAQGILFAKKALYNAEHSKDNGNIEIALVHLANENKGLNRLDSALYYAKRAITFYHNTGWAGVLLPLASIYFQLGRYDSALHYYRELVVPSMALDVTIDVVDAYLGIAKVYQQFKKVDSSIFYANKVLREFPLLSYIKGRLAAADLLAENYQLKKNSDSTLKYLKLSIVYKDSLYSEERIKTLQNIAFSEKLRQQELEHEKKQYQNNIKTYILLGGLLAALFIASLLYRNNLQKQKAKRTVEKAYNELRSTQSQLIQSEKMASLGELTAGIAHEIQNPLNFVNNFSEVNTELVDELKSELATGNTQSAIEIAEDIKENEQKINHHGKRADAIVKGMLQHSRTSSGQKELTDINALTDEYLRLAYHGLRAKEKSFNADFKTDFDESVGKINIVPQDVGRVILNLINNAFYAVSEKAKLRSASGGYEPRVVVRTKRLNDHIEIKVEDNGNGIPQKILDKIFQPFFTTKPAGQGTGLGLSLAYDIVKGHGGEIKVKTGEEGTEFVIQLPGI
jgi:signal transduction histidine kinase